MKQLAVVLHAAYAEQRRTRRCAREQAIAEATGLAPERVQRALIEAARHGLVRRLVGSGLRPTVSSWVVTAEGRRELAEGLAAGGRPKPLADDDMRSRAWRAMRAQRKFSAATVMAVIFEVDTFSAARWASTRVRLSRYLQLLEAVAVIVCIHRSREGKRYCLLEDLGPLAPVPRVATARLWDPNAGRFIERPTAAQVLASADARSAA